MSKKMHVLLYDRGNMTKQIDENTAQMLKQLDEIKYRLFFLSFLLFSLLIKLVESRMMQHRFLFSSLALQ